MKKIFLFVLCLIASSMHAELSFLQTQGAKIVDEKGVPVVLRGINFGSWLAEEAWMLPFKKTPPRASNFFPITDHFTLWQVVEKRFGKLELEKMRTHFRSAFFQESDFARIAKAQFNCIRLPFFHDVAEEPQGLFVWLDKAVAAAAKYGLYLILDMHGAPGRQNTKQHSGQEHIGKLFKDPQFVKKTCELWKKIAERYKDVSSIAGYDLLNEPEGATNSATLYLVQDQIYRAIRQVDTKHMIFIEDGFKGLTSMPEPHVVGWNNVVYSIHTYPHGDNSDAALKELIEQLVICRSSYSVPVYLGEFNVKSNSTVETIRKYILQLQEKGISWSLWTYKLAGKKKPGSTWGLYNRPKKFKKIDLFQESKEKIYKRLHELRTERLEENAKLLDMLVIMQKKG